MYICISCNSVAHVSTMLPLYIAAVLSNRIMHLENKSVLFASKFYQIYILLSQGQRQNIQHHKMDSACLQHPLCHPLLRHGAIDIMLLISGILW